MTQTPKFQWKDGDRFVVLDANKFALKDNVSPLCPVHTLCAITRIHLDTSLNYTIDFVPGPRLFSTGLAELLRLVETGAIKPWATPSVWL